MGGLTSTNAIKYTKEFEFPSPLEAAGGYYGVLKSDEEFFKLSFPSPLEVIGVSNRVGLLLEVKPVLFPSPLEVIGVSNGLQVY